MIAFIASFRGSVFAQRWGAIFLFSALSMVSAAGGAWAEDYTFNVPVLIEDLPEGAEPEVFCGLRDDRSPLFDASVPVPIEDGFFDGTVTVAFDVEDEEIRQAAVAYLCYLSLNGLVWVRSWEECEERGTAPRENPLICGARGAQVLGEYGSSF
ncbi:MAG: hypothetical protein O7A03_11565 [Alphaproteobacteria bacterium]|nr:hypothetical protein [Alphaproteobacteria bacterium]